MYVKFNDQVYRCKDTGTDECKYFLFSCAFQIKHMIREMKITIYPQTEYYKVNELQK